MAKSISAQEVTSHNKPDDCWIVVNGKVYNVTSFASSHPGGVAVIHKWAGKDGSEEYNMFHAAELIEKTLSSTDKLGDFDQSSVTQSWIDSQKARATPKSGRQEGKPALSTLINLNDFEEAFAKHSNPKSLVYVSDAANGRTPSLATQVIYANLAQISSPTRQTGPIGKSFGSDHGSCRMFPRPIRQTSRWSDVAFDSPSGFAQWESPKLQVLKESGLSGQVRQAQALFIACPLPQA